ncbi:hypothetical protein EC957_003473 [Mortierella hygrophila]|uniref:Vacuolar ATPase assembly protein VMA22 n=1 Tax=Mortierella hygrophila TaxID=979708 RepID=A0A9P6FFC0_9FUNG|nr:hypothetical protein EC957_003473 [Mortierella hygrophila]
MPDVTGVQQQAHNKVCQDLDDLVLEYIALVNEHLTAWTRISTRFQEGRELISQAKYIMGPKNVSADCYDHRMKALRGVLIKDRLTEIEIRDLRAEEVERQRLQEAQEEESKAAERDSDSHRQQGSGTGYDDQEQKQGQSGLRRRGGGVGSEDASSSVATTAGMATIDPTSSGTTVVGGADDEVTKTKRKERNPDPLLWFGVFVPGALRSAQTVFQQGLQDVVEMAMIRQRLSELEGRMVVLREAKAAGTKELEADISEMKL